jgi:hypothetical protein
VAVPAFGGYQSVSTVSQRATLANLPIGEKMEKFDFESYLIEARQQFENDPADTDYQRGYHAALNEMNDAFINSLRPSLMVIEGGLK